MSLRSDNLESGGELYTKDDFREPAAVELSIAKGTGPIAFDARGGTRLFIPNRMLEEQPWNSHSSTANQTESPNCRSL